MLFVEEGTGRSASSPESKKPPATSEQPIMLIEGFVSNMRTPKQEKTSSENPYFLARNGNTKASANTEYFDEHSDELLDILDSGVDLV